MKVGDKVKIQQGVYFNEVGTIIDIVPEAEYPFVVRVPINGRDLTMFFAERELQEVEEPTQAALV